MGFDNSASFYKNSPGNPSQIINPNPTSFYTETAAFNLVYYGALSSPPTVDPFGNPVLTGALYYDTGRTLLFVFDGTSWHPYAATSTSLEFVIDGNGSAITPGFGSTYLEIPYDCTVVQWTVMSGLSGSIQLDVQKCTFAQFSPPTHPGSGDSIVASAPPMLTSALSSQSHTLPGWTTNLTQGDIIGISITSATTVTRVTLSLKIVRR